MFLHYHSFYKHFNPIIVLFLTTNILTLTVLKNTYFNPIIVLFLTPSTTVLVAECPVFQSYYSLIFNIKKTLLRLLFQNFNPIIVLFLTGHIFSQKGQKQFIIYLFMHLNLLIIKNVFYLYVSTKKIK